MTDGVGVPTKLWKQSSGKGSCWRGVSGETKGRVLRELPSTEWLPEFQKKLHAMAKAEPKFWFYTLYDKTYRTDVLEEAYRKAKSNGGACGVDGETVEDVEKKGVAIHLAELQLETKGLVLNGLTRYRRHVSQ
jgi:hypothetical protein